MTRRAAILAGLLVLILGGAGLAGTTYYLQRSAPAVRTSSVGGPFTLTDQDGRTVSDKDFAGRPFIVFFGYTNCPDVCPATLFELSEALNKLGAEAGAVPVLFVSVDPDHDKPEVLKQYLSNFNPGIRGLTGTDVQLRAMAKAYRAYYAKAPGEGDAYTMDHTAVVYLMDRQGNFVAPFNTKRPPSDMAADLRRALG